MVAESRTPYVVAPVTKEDVARMVKELESQMKAAARSLEFEKAALLRDQIFELRQNLADSEDDIPEWERVRLMAHTAEIA